MNVWLKRAVHLLDLLGVGFLLLLLLDLLVAWLTGYARANAADTTVNIPILIKIVHWAGRLSVFAVLGARAAGRYGEWWLAAIAAPLAPIGAVVAREGTRYVKWAMEQVPVLPALQGGLETALDAPGLLEALLVGVLMGPVGALFGPRLRSTKGGKPAPLMVGVGGLAFLVLAAAVAVRVF